MSRLKICVFCGAKPGVSAAGLNAATELGTLLGRQGHHLVYGAGGSGVMGALAWATAHAGGTITGVVPAFLRDREQSQALPGQRLVITADLLERKRRMIELADAFIALPGGYGTLDEIFDVIGQRYLDQHAKPLVLLDIDGIWSDLVRLTERLHEHGYALPAPSSLFHLAADPAAALDLLTRTPVAASHTLDGATGVTG